MIDDQVAVVENMAVEAKRQGKQQYQERGAVAGATLPLYLASVDELTRQNAGSLKSSFQELVEKRDAATRADQAVPAEWEKPRTYPVVLILAALLVVIVSPVLDSTRRPWFGGPFVIAIVATLWRRRRWHIHRDRKVAKAAGPRAERDLAEQRFARALQESVLAPAFSRAVAVEWKPHDQIIAVDDDRSLSSKIDPTSVVTTNASTRIALALLREEGTAIGVAGERGAGKTQLVRNFARTNAKTLGVFLWAPSKVDHFSFLLHLLKRLCEEGLSALGGPSNSRWYDDRERAFSAIRNVYLGLTASAVLISLGLALVLGVILDFDIRDHKIVWGLGCIAAGLVLLWSLYRKKRRQWSPHLSDLYSRESTSGYDSKYLAQMYLRQAEFTEIYSMNAELTAKLTPVEGKIGYGRGYERRPLTDVDTVHAIGRLVKALRSDGFEIVVGIDELDKIGSDEEAMAFLNAIKILFPIDGCSFITSVSENVWVRFEQRGLPFRDVFDSAFDEVVHVTVLTPRESRDLLRSREPRLTDVQCLFCYTLSGGVPRDLLRIARRLVQVASTLRGRQLVEVINKALNEDLDGKFQSTRARISQVVPAQHRWEYFRLTALSERWTSPASDMLVTPSASVRARVTSHGTEVEEWRDVADLAVAELNAYVAFLMAVRATFGKGGAVMRLDDTKGFEDDIVKLVCAPLADARAVIGVDPRSAEEMIGEVLRVIRSQST